NDTVLGTNFWAGYVGNTIVVGDEVPNTNVLQESTNFGFGFISSLIPGVGATTGDIPAGEYEVYAQVLNAKGDVVTKVGIIFDLVDPNPVALTAPIVEAIEFL